MFKIKLEGGKTREVEESVYWHTTSHIMAQAVKRLFPEAKMAIGPSIENGFYYDFDIEQSFSEEDLIKIEEEMKKIEKENNWCMDCGEITVRCSDGTLDKEGNEIE